MNTVMRTMSSISPPSGFMFSCQATVPAMDHSFFMLA